MIAKACRSSAQREPKTFYDRQGYVGPFTAFEPGELKRMRIISLIDSLDKVCRWGRNRHLDIPAIARICRSESVISRVRAVMGSDLLLWRSNIFAISARDRGFEWHQDEYRTLLRCPSGAAQCSVQINFSDSTKLNRVTIIPGTHRWTDDELRRRGYAMRLGSDGGQYGTPQWTVPTGIESLDMPMQAGQFYVFHPRLLHASVRARWFRGQVGEGSWVPRLRQRLHTAAETLLRREAMRYSIALRIATPNTMVLAGAFAESPARAGVVLLAGKDTAGINKLGKWAA